MRSDAELARVMRGVLVAVLLNMMAILVFAVLFPFLIPLIGVVQLLYIIPCIFNLKKYGESATIKGIIIGASSIALVNLTGWLALLIRYK